ncbi:porin family protein [Photobacterium damselae subsp. damselae]|uniref:porin family protein n=1 Tax=Photobacterium damselae TaxID=38293 RepID=UPI001F4036A5|nr:porin family protein [Photobacterium damselae]MCG3847188.1 porin family protein [Photobacterium damselae]UKA26033.1 porin family protein [Photobacterium damselae subsp. damselae]
MNKTLLSIGSFITLFSIPTLAQTADVNLTPFALNTDGHPHYYAYLAAGTYAPKLKHMGNSFTKEDKKPDFSLGMGMDINPYLAMEGFYRYASTDYFSGLVKLSGNEIGFSVLPSTGEIANTGLKLYARLSASVLMSELKILGHNEDKTDVALGAGAGIQWNLNHQFMLRAEYLYTQFDHNYGNDIKGDNFDGFQFSAGYRF